MMTFRDFTQFFLTLHLNKKVHLNIELVVFSDTLCQKFAV